MEIRLTAPRTVNATEFLGLGEKKKKRKLELFALSSRVSWEACFERFSRIRFQMEEDSLSRIVKDVAKIVRLESGLEKRLKDC